MCQNQIFEADYMENQRSKSMNILKFQENNTLVYDNFQTNPQYDSKDDDMIQGQQNVNHELQENIEKEVVELHHFEHEDVTNQNTSLEKINSELFDCQKDIPHIQRVVVAFKVFQGWMLQIFFLL